MRVAKAVSPLTYDTFGQPYAMPMRSQQCTLILQRSCNRITSCKHVLHTTCASQNRHGVGPSPSFLALGRMLQKMLFFVHAHDTVFPIFRLIFVSFRTANLFTHRPVSLSYLCLCIFLHLFLFISSYTVYSHAAFMLTFSSSPSFSRQQNTYQLQVKEIWSTSILGANELI